MNNTSRIVVAIFACTLSIIFAVVLASQHYRIMEMEKKVEYSHAQLDDMRAELATSIEVIGDYIKSRPAR